MLNIVNVLIMNLLKIKRLAESRVGGIKKLASDIGMSEANMHRCINANRMQGTDLEKIANIFKVPVGFFFDEVEESEDYIKLINNLKEEIERLKNSTAKDRNDSSSIFLAIPIDSDEFLDLREMKDKIIKVLKTP